MNIMKKYLLMLAAFVAATATFTACSSEEDVVDPSGERSNDRGSVKTEFTISIPQGTSAMTRLSSGIVQSAENLASFRGIKGIELYPFSSKIEAKTTTTPGFPATETTIPSKIILLGSSANGKSGSSGSTHYAIDGQSNLFTTSQTHLYQEVDIPVGTKSFMFYGEAAGNQAESVQGALVYTSSGSTLGGITFSPSQIYANGEVGTYGTTIAAYLTSIANATSGDKKWKQTDNVALKSLFEQFTGEAENGTLTNNGIKAGSWTNVKAALKELYKNLEVKEGSAETESTKNMKNAIRSAIASTTYGVTASGNDLSFKTQDPTDNKYSSVLCKVDETTGVETPYPRDLGLPDGAAYIRWNVTNQAFEALKDNAYTGSNFASLDKFVYPASLYYRVLSNIKTSSTLKGVGTSGYNDDKTWNDILALYNKTTEETAANYDNESVSGTTRSILIKDPIQYAVGRLDATIIATGTTITDNPNPQTAIKQNFEVGSSSTIFKVTGILVGGQKPVDYKFEQKTDASTFYTIYDHSIDGDVYLRSTNSAPVYTLALETKSASTANDEGAVVKIAVEFENNSDKTIIGKNNELIYPGCRFYLIGTLDPYSNVTQTYDGTTADPTNNPDNIIRKAFVQDFKTVVKLSIANLENAYVTLPDLTLPQLEMGLSVDLKWKTGINMTINME